MTVARLDGVPLAGAAHSCEALPPTTNDVVELPRGSTAEWLVLSSFGSTGVLGLTSDHVDAGLHLRPVGRNSGPSESRRGAPRSRGGDGPVC